jgi:hypothetical protein
MNKIVGDISMKTPTKEFLASIGNVSCTDSFAVCKCLLVFSNSFSIFFVCNNSVIVNIQFEIKVA